MLRKNLSTLLNCTVLDTVLSTRVRDEVCDVINRLAQSGYLEVIKGFAFYLNDSEQIDIIVHSVECFQNHLVEWLICDIVSDWNYMEIVKAAAKHNNIVALSLVPPTYITMYTDRIMHPAIIDKHNEIVKFMLDRNSAISHYLPLAIHSENVIAVKLMLKCANDNIMHRVYVEALLVRNVEIIRAIYEHSGAAFRERAKKTDEEWKLDVD
jgi:hypothetical protein